MSTNCEMANCKISESDHYLIEYVKLNSSKNLSTDFTLPDEDTLIFIEKHIDMLNERLEKLGFNVTNTFNTKSTAPEVLLDEEDNSDKKDAIGFYRFDVRA